MATNPSFIPQIGGIAGINAPTPAQQAVETVQQGGGLTSQEIKKIAEPKKTFAQQYQENKQAVENAPQLKNTSEWGIKSVLDIAKTFHKNIAGYDYSLDLRIPKAEKNFYAQNEKPLKAASYEIASGQIDPQQFDQKYPQLSNRKSDIINLLQDVIKNGETNVDTLYQKYNLPKQFVADMAFELHNQNTLARAPKAQYVVAPIAADQVFYPDNAMKTILGTARGAGEFVANMMVGWIPGVQGLLEKTGLLTDEAKKTGGTPYMIHNTAAFFTNLLTDPEKTIADLVYGLDDVGKNFNTTQEKEGFMQASADLINSATKFLIENPAPPELGIKVGDIMALAEKAGIPADLLKGGGKRVTLLDDITAQIKDEHGMTPQEYITSELQKEGKAITPENITQKGQQIFQQYTEKVIGKNTEATKAEVTTQGVGNVGVNDKGETVARPVVARDKNIDNAAIRIFGNSIGLKKDPAKFSRSLDSIIKGSEALLINRDQYPDLFGENVQKLKSVNLLDAADAVSTIKDNLRKNIIDPMITEGSAIAEKVDMTPFVDIIQNDIDSMIDNYGDVMPGMETAYKELTNQLDYFVKDGQVKTLSVQDLQSMSKNINKILKPFYRGQGDTLDWQKFFYMEGLNQLLKDTINTSIETTLDQSGLGALKKEWGSLKQFEEIISKQGQKEPRKIPGNSLVDYTAGFLGANEIVSAITNIVTGNFGAAAGDALKVIGIKAVKDFLNKNKEKGIMFADLLKDVDKQMKGYHVPGGYSAKYEVPAEIKAKVQAEREATATAARKERIRSEVQTKLQPVENALPEKVPEITPEGVIKGQYGSSAPMTQRAAGQDITEISPSQKQPGSTRPDILEPIQEKEKIALQKAVKEQKIEEVYAKAQDFGIKVYRDDPFLEIQKGDVTSKGIVEDVGVNNFGIYVTIDGKSYKPESLQPVYRIDKIEEVQKKVEEEVDSFVADMIKTMPATEVTNKLGDMSNDELHKLYEQHKMNSGESMDAPFIEEANKIEAMEQRIGTVAGKKVGATDKGKMITKKQKEERQTKKETFIEKIGAEYNLDANEAVNKYNDLINRSVNKGSTLSPEEVKYVEDRLATDSGK